MIDLKDMTFTLPIRLDTEERKRNLITTVKYLNKHFDTLIRVYEESPVAEVAPLIAQHGLKCIYKYIPSTSPLMCRTKLLNLMARDSTTPFIANYDVDVLLKVPQILNSVVSLRKDYIKMIYPYNGQFIDIHGPVLENVINNLNVEQLTPQSGNLIHPHSLGGAVFWNKNTFFNIGLENENFVSWGYEDNERFVRASKLGVVMARADGCLFHMHHPPSVNSANTSHKPFFDNQKEFEKINQMSPQQLRSYVESWSWR